MIQRLITERDAAEAERDRLAAQLAAVREMAQRAIRVNFRGPHDTDAAMMLGAADKLDQGFEVGGSNVREAVARTLRFATALAASASTPEVDHG